jgi:trehalose 6-phosphate synthase/phosphatase
MARRLVLAFGTQRRLQFYRQCYNGGELNLKLNKGMDLVSKYATAKKRLLTIEYDGVLVPPQLQPGLTIPDREIRAVIEQLAADSRNAVMLLSGRDQEHLDLHWSRRNLILVAEHGAIHRNRNASWSKFFEPENTWIDPVELSLKHFVFQYAGSFFERRRHSLAWNYGSLSDRISTSEIREVISAIRAQPYSDQFKIYQPYRSIELRSRGLTHPEFIRKWIGKQEFDYTLAIGADESSFPVFEFSRSIIPITLTSSKERSTQVLDSQSEVVSLLKSLLGTTAATKKLSIWPFS